MSFDTALHDKTPSGFRVLDKKDNPKTFKLVRKQHTGYAAEDLDFSVYGLQNTGVQADLKTYYHKVKIQDATVTLLFDTRKEGQESRDSEKVRVLREIAVGLLKEFRHYTISISANKSIEIRLPDTCVDPLKEFMHIKETLRQIKSEYDAGKKPLGNILLPGELPDLPAEAQIITETSAETPPAPPPKPTWSDRVRDKTIPAEEVARLAAQHFPVGMTITEGHIEDFKEAVAGQVNGQVRT